jgi:hypothetical protein
MDVTVNQQAVQELIFPHAAEVAELEAAGIAPHAVDALYPTSFEQFAANLMQALEADGCQALRALPGTKRWDDIVAITSSMFSILAQRYIAFGQGSDSASRLPLYEFVDQSVLDLHASALESQLFADWYMGLAFTIYWLTTHTDDPFIKQGPGLEPLEGFLLGSLYHAAE